MKKINLILTFLLIGFGFSLKAAASGSEDYIFTGDKTSIFVVAGLLVSLSSLFLVRHMFYRKPQKKLGFWSIVPHRRSRFFSLNGKVHNMIPVVETLADENINVYSNLSKITLTMKGNSVFLEDKNYKISILINRRRARRCFLKDGDILDMGELTLMFSSPVPRPARQDVRNHNARYIIPRARRTQAKIIRNTPTLIPMDSREKTFYLTKNVTFIGRSAMNDLTPKSKGASLRHSKIERVAGKYKIVDLNSIHGTFINGRRIDSKFLHDGDEISFESMRYIFSLSGKVR